LRFELVILHHQEQCIEDLCSGMPPSRQRRTLAHFCCDKSRGYCLEMICADFLAGANLDNGNPDLLLNSISHFFKFLPGEQQQMFVEQVSEKVS
jgi:hypothetical protein